MTDTTSEIKIRNEFNQWAEAGRGEEMEDHHLPIVAPALALMDLKPGDHVLDLGCGSGWLCRRIARLVPEGRVVGIDIAPEMVRRARSAGRNTPTLVFLKGLPTEFRAPAVSSAKSFLLSLRIIGPMPPEACGRCFAFSAKAEARGF